MEGNKIMKTINRMEIYFTDLGRQKGSIQGGRRPFLIISNNIGNKYSPTVIGVIITSVDKSKYIPTIVNIGKNYGLTEESCVHCEQIFTINKSQLEDYVGIISDSAVENEINNALKISLGVN